MELCAKQYVIENFLQKTLLVPKPQRDPQADNFKKSLIMKKKLWEHNDSSCYAVAKDGHRSESVPLENWATHRRQRRGRLGSDLGNEFATCFQKFSRARKAGGFDLWKAFIGWIRHLTFLDMWAVRTSQVHSYATDVHVQIHSIQQRHQHICKLRCLKKWSLFSRYLHLLTALSHSGLLMGPWRSLDWFFYYTVP